MFEYIIFLLFAFSLLAAGYKVGRYRERKSWHDAVIRKINQLRNENQMEQSNGQAGK